MTTGSTQSRRRARSAIASMIGLAFVLGASACSGTDPVPSAASGSAASLPTPSPSPVATPSGDTSPAPTTAPRPTGPPAPFHPEVGQCLDVRKEARSGPDSIVPCEEAHDDEAYAAYALDGSSYPGPDIESLATEGCRARFADFVGIAFRGLGARRVRRLPDRRDMGGGGPRRHLPRLVPSGHGRRVARGRRVLTAAQRRERSGRRASDIRRRLIRGGWIPRSPGHLPERRQSSVIRGKAASSSVPTGAAIAP